MSFAQFGLKATSLAVLESLGIEDPTPIQLEALPVLLEGHDVVGQAQTGSGKTLAFGLPLVEHCDPTRKEVQAVVLTPTRELAQQVSNVITELARPARLTVATVYGGVGFVPQVEAVQRGAQILVGTPGRVLDHLRRGSLRLGGVTMLVLDEADQMLDKGFAPDVERIISTTPRTRQTALFSATTPSWVKDVSARHLREPIFLKVGDTEPDLQIEHTVVECWDGDKLPVLLKLLNRPTDGATLVFGRTRHGVANLARKLQHLGYDCEALQGDMSQPARDRIIQRFRDGSLPIVLATNVAARGLDILLIDHVINYDLPETSELFVHRVGRTGRMGRSGEATTLVTAADLQVLQTIERSLGRKLPRVPASRLQGSSTAPVPQAPRLAPMVRIVAPPAPVAVAIAVEAADGLEPAKRKRRHRGGRGRGPRPELDLVVAEA